MRPKGRGALLGQGRPGGGCHLPCHSQVHRSPTQPPPPYHQNISHTVGESSLGRIQRRLVWHFLPDLTTDTLRLMTDITSHMRRAGRHTRSPLKTGRITVKVKDFGVNALAAGQVGETIYLFSGSLFGELVVRAISKSKSGAWKSLPSLLLDHHHHYQVSWAPAAFENAMTYQFSAGLPPIYQLYLLFLY